MAIAGKVAITLSEENNGKWSASVTYDKLVAVTHNNNLYISKKTSTNEEPTVTNEFWFLALEGFSGETLHGILDGTIAVGNALKLNGHGAEYFASAEGVKKNNIWNELTEGFDLNNALGKYRTSLGAIIISLLNKPDGVGGGELTVEWFPTEGYNLFGMQILRYETPAKREIYFRVRQNTTWSAWDKIATTADLAKYLPLTGGKLEGYLRMSMTNTVSGYSQLVKNNSATADYGTQLTDKDNSGNIMRLTVDALNQKFSITDKNNKEYAVHHTGNKPTGTYTGNGDATQRTIQTNGIGSALYVRNITDRAEYKYSCVFVLPNGYFGKDENGNFVSGQEVFVSANASLVIKSTSPIFNKSGATYEYGVL